MGAVNDHDGKLYLDFRYKGVRCREQTSHIDNHQNRNQLEKLISMIESEIKLGKFDYARYFPDSPKVEKFEGIVGQEKFKRIGKRMLCGVFAEIWFAEKQVEWRLTQIENARGILDKHLLPAWKYHVTQKRKRTSRNTKGRCHGFQAQTYSGVACYQREAVTVQD